MSTYVVDIDVLSAIADAVVVFLGGVLTLLAVRAAHRTGSTRLRFFAIGFAVITLGALAELGLTGTGNGPIGTVFRSLITAIGFGLLAYSLYATDLDEAAPARTDHGRT